MTDSPFDVLRAIQPRLKALDAIPLTGESLAFDWNELSSRLAKLFDREGLKIEPGEMAWRSAEELYEGLGDTPFPLNFSFPTLRGQVSWVMPEQEMAVIAALLLTTDTHPLPLYDRDLNESFYHFLALEVLAQFTEIFSDKTLIPILAHEATLPRGDALCWDISMILQGHTMWGRLIITPEFRRAWVEHFAAKGLATPLSEEIAKCVSLDVHIEMGRTELKWSEWASLQLGDILLLDRCTFEVEKKEGRVGLVVDGKHLFRAKLKEGTLKILELPILHEVETAMVKQSDDEFEEELSHLNFLDEQIPEESAAEETSEVGASSYKEDGKNDFVKLDPMQMPVNLVVEVGQVSMTMDQLLKLEPGNLLDVSLRPENGVDLTVRGNLVGRGELIRIGEAIGVRVLQLGRK